MEIVRRRSKRSTAEMRPFIGFGAPASPRCSHWKRDLSIAMIRRLHERLGISAEVLIRPVRKRAA